MGKIGVKTEQAWSLCARSVFSMSGRLVQAQIGAEASSRLERETGMMLLLTCNRLDLADARDRDSVIGRSETSLPKSQ